MRHAVLERCGLCSLFLKATARLCHPSPEILRSHYRRSATIACTLIKEFFYSRLTVRPNGGKPPELLPRKLNPVRRFYSSDHAFCCHLKPQ